MQDIPNRWRMFIGYLAESTTTLNQRTFRVFVPELLPTTSGDVTTNIATHNIKIKNTITNESEEMTVDVASTVVAEYMGLMISRSVPTMYKGQQVIVFNYANSDVFFWMPLERDDDLRPFEQVRLSANDVALTNKSDEDKQNIEARHSHITDDNTYFIEIDTKYHKRILLSTACTDGEAFRYFIKMDASSKSIELWDECGSDAAKPCNTIAIESDIGGGISRVKMENSFGTSLIMTGEDMTINVPGNLNVFVGKDAQSTIMGNVTTAINGNEDNTVIGNHTYRCVGNLTGNVAGTTGFTGTGLVAFKSEGATAVNVAGVYTEVMGAKSSNIGPYVEKLGYKTSTIASVYKVEAASYEEVFEIATSAIGKATTTTIELTEHIDTKTSTIDVQNITVGESMEAYVQQTLSVTVASWKILYPSYARINIDEHKKFSYLISL